MTRGRNTVSNETPNMPEGPVGPEQPGQFGPQLPYGQPPLYGQQPVGQPPYGQVPYGHVPYGQPRKTNTLAIVSLVSAFFVSLVAIITGHMALSQIKRTGEQGRGMAIAGLIIGYVSVALTLVLAVLVLLGSLLGLGLGIFGALIGSGVSNSPSYPSSTSGPSNSSSAPSTAPEASGTVGAAHFDDGFIQVGNGPVIVDYFFDPMCPFCAVFHETNGFTLDISASFDETTLRMHPLNFLDSQSQGTAYSSRAGSAVACVAALDEDQLGFYLSTLFDEQPAEGTAGLTSSELANLWIGLGADTTACIEADTYVDWAKTVNDNALSGATSTTLGLPEITGTPAIFVDGKQYMGALDDAAEFETFLEGK